MAESSYKIPRWPKNERPRERLLQDGPQHLSAAFGLVRRVQSRKGADRPLFKRSSDVAGHYLPLMRDLRKEVFKVLLLNRANRFIKEAFISEGTLDASVVHPRDVFREALLEPAAAIILIHNNPRGNPSPSDDDLRSTKQLVE